MQSIVSDSALSNALRPMFPGDLTGGVLHLWCLPLTGGKSEVANLRRLLSHSELSRTERFRSPALRSNSVASRGLIRRLLGAYLNQPPELLQFSSTTQGKPFLAGSRLRFNVSHSHELLLVGIAVDMEIGVDIERVVDGLDIERVVSELLPSSERERIASFTLPQRRRWCFQAWTGIEARLKCGGGGLSRIPAHRLEDGLSSIDVPIDESYVAAVSTQQPANVSYWRFCTFKDATMFFSQVSVSTESRGACS